VPEALSYPEGIPEEVISVLTACAESLLRELDVADLPAPLRPLKRFNPRRLGTATARATLRRVALDAGPFRSRIEERVGERYSDVAEALRQGTVLPDGPADQLAACCLALGPDYWQEPLRAALARLGNVALAQEEAASARCQAKLRDELESVRSRMRDDLAKAEGRRKRFQEEAEELSSKVRSLQADLRRESRISREAEGSVRTAEAAREAAEEREGRETRRLKAGLDAAREEVLRLKSELEASHRVERDLREERAAAPPAEVTGALGDIESAVRALREHLEPGRFQEERIKAEDMPRRNSKSRESAPSGSQRGRTRRRVPRGVDEDDPGSLELIASMPNAWVLVDGYNVTKHPEGFAGVPLEAQRTRLVALLESFRRRTGAEVEVVFDGQGPLAPGVARPVVRGIRVVFTEAGESADAYLMRRVRELDPDLPVAVVSADREVRDAAEIAGANLARPPALLRSERR